MSEFINTDDDADDAAKIGGLSNSISATSANNNYGTYILVAVVSLLLIVVIMNYFTNGGISMFQGAFPIRSDAGSDKFDLQQEVEKLTEKQINNLGY